MSRPAAPDDGAAADDDATHGRHVRALVGSNVGAYGAADKVRMALATAVFAVTVALPGKVASVARRAMGTEQVSVSEVVPGHVYVVPYDMPSGPSNCVVLRSEKGELLMRSPPPLDGDVGARRLAKVKELGTPTALVGTVPHDTFVDRWAALFPEAEILAPKADADVVSARQRVTRSLEDASEDLRSKWGLTRSFPSSWTPFQEPYWVVRARVGLGDAETNVLVLPCGFAHMPFQWTNPMSWLLLAGGVAYRSPSGVGVPRPFAWFFSGPRLALGDADVAVARQVPNVRFVVPMHGTPFKVDSAADALAGVVPSRARSFWWS